MNQKSESQLREYNDKANNARKEANDCHNDDYQTWRQVELTENSRNFWAGIALNDLLAEIDRLRALVPNESK